MVEIDLPLNPTMRDFVKLFKLLEEADTYATDQFECRLTKSNYGSGNGFVLDFKIQLISCEPMVLKTSIQLG